MQKEYQYYVFHSQGQIFSLRLDIKQFEYFGDLIEEIQNNFGIQNISLFYNYKHSKCMIRSFAQFPRDVEDIYATNPNVVNKIFYDFFIFYEFFFFKENSSITLIVKTMKGQTLSVEVKRDDKILKIKEKIQDKFGIHIDQQKLLFQQSESHIVKILESESKISDYSFEQDNIIRLVVQVMGD